MFPWSAKRLVTIFVLLAAVALLPVVGSNFLVNIANFTLIAVVGALGLQVVTGMAGQLSLGHAAFLAVGAIVSSGLWLQLSVPFWAAVPLAAAAGGLLGLVAGIPALRLRGFYLGITTLAVQSVVVVAGLKYQLYLQREYGTGADLTVPAPSLGLFEVTSVRGWYWLLLVFAGVGVAVVANLSRSRLGRDWTAITRREVVAESLGIDVARQKLIAFVISGVFGGVGGALLAYYFRQVSIENFNLQLSVEYLAMIMIGGLGLTSGAVYGAIFVTATPFVVGELVERLGLSEQLGTKLRGLELAVFALAIMGFLLLESDGIAGVWRRIKAYFTRWPYRYTTLSRGSS
jgi:branched-chain amino acid transport system permease protein